MASPDDQPDPAAPEQLGYIQRTVAALKQRVRRLLSPWVQRQLPVAGPRPGARPGLGVRRRPALTTGHTRLVLNRLQRTVERATVWKPDLGSLAPTAIQRFSRTVANRPRAVELVGVQRRPRSPAFGWGEEMELTLPVGPESPGPRPGELTVGSRIKGPSVFSMPGRQPSSPPRARRVVSRPQPRKLSPKSRLFTHVEEVSAGGEPLPAAERAEEPPAPAERDRESKPRARAEPRPPAKPSTVQRKARKADTPRPAKAPPPRRARPVQPERPPKPVPRRAERRWEAAPERPLPVKPPRGVSPEPSPPAVQRQAEGEGEAAPEMPLPGKPPRGVPPEPSPPPPPIQRRAEGEREAAPEMPLRGKPPRGVPPEPSSPAVQRQAEGEGEAAPERPLPVKPPRGVPPEPSSPPPTIQRRAEGEGEAAPEMPLPVEPPPGAPPEPPAPELPPAAGPPTVRLQAEGEEEALEMPLRVRPPREAPPGPPAIQREPSPARPPRAEGVPPETGQPAVTLGRDLLARLALRTRVLLRKPVRPASRRVARTPSKVKPRPARAEPRRPGIAPPTRDSHVYVGPRPSLTLLDLESAHLVRRTPASVPPSRSPESPLERMQAFFEAREGRGEEAMVLPFLPRPASPGSSSRPPGTEPATAAPSSGAGLPGQPSLPLARPSAPRTPSERPPASPVVVQRQPAPPAISSFGEAPLPQGTVVQRAGEQAGQPETPDLPDLAREVYPFIKRMLLIERERVPGHPA